MHARKQGSEYINSSTVIIDNQIYPLTKFDDLPVIAVLLELVVILFTESNQGEA